MICVVSLGSHQYKFVGRNGCTDIDFKLTAPDALQESFLNSLRRPNPVSIANERSKRKSSVLVGKRRHMLKAFRCCPKS